MDALKPLLELLENGREYSREEVLKMIASRLEEINEINPADLFNLFYKMDISERKVDQAFLSNEPYIRMAELVIERQLQKLKTRRMYPTDEWIETE